MNSPAAVLSSSSIWRGTVEDRTHVPQTLPLPVLSAKVVDAPGTTGGPSRTEYELGAAVNAGGRVSRRERLWLPQTRSALRLLRLAQRLGKVARM